VRPARSHGSVVFGCNRARNTDAARGWGGTLAVFPSLPRDVHVAANNQRAFLLSVAPSRAPWGAAARVLPRATCSSEPQHDPACCVVVAPWAGHSKRVLAPPGLVLDLWAVCVCVCCRLRSGQRVGHVSLAQPRVGRRRPQGEHPTCPTHRVLLHPSVGGTCCPLLLPHTLKTRLCPVVVASTPPVYPRTCHACCCRTHPPVVPPPPYLQVSTCMHPHTHTPPPWHPLQLGGLLFGIEMSITSGVKTHKNFLDYFHLHHQPFKVCSGRSRVHCCISPPPPHIRAPPPRPSSWPATPGVVVPAERCMRSRGVGAAVGAHLCAPCGAVRCGHCTPRRACSPRP
jgi:hypothetical protein